MIRWRDAAFVARKHLRYLAFDGETVLWTTVMPIVFFYFIGTVTSGFADGGGPLGGEPLGVVRAEDGGFLQDQVVRRAAELDFELVEAGEGRDPAQLGRRLVFPAGFTERALAGEQAVVRFERSGGGLSADFEEVRLTRAVYTVLADLLVLEQEGTEPAPEAFAELAARERAVQVDVRPAGERPVIPTGFEQAIPGIMVMFTMSILLSGGAVLLVVERERGLLRRLASAPLSRGSVVLGKWLGNLALGLVQIAFALVVGRLLFGLHWGDALVGVYGVLFLWAGFTAAVALLLGNLARSEAQAAGLGTLAALVLAALGGCWWPIEITPDWMQSLALALPTGWTMDAMHRLVSFGQPAAAVAPHALALAAGTAVAGWLAARTFRYG